MTNKEIAASLETLLWPNMAEGNRIIIQSAIDALRRPVKLASSFDVYPDENRSPVQDVMFTDDLVEMLREQGIEVEE